jgi:hypothetical protein
MDDELRRADLMPRSRISIGVDPTFRGSLARLARDRALVISYFASARCGVVVGDLSTSWRSTAPGAKFQRLEAVEGVELFVDARLLEVLASAAPELGPPSFLRRGTPTLSLGLPERWLDFLEGRPASR